MSDATQAPAPTGVVACFVPENASAAADFYKKAFDAEELARIPSSDHPDRLMHCSLRINGDSIIINDAFPEHGFAFEPLKGFSLHLQVDDAQAWYDRAVAAGCNGVMPPAVMFWGDLYGQVIDPFGVRWAFGQALPKP